MTPNRRSSAFAVLTAVTTLVVVDQVHEDTPELRATMGEVFQDADNDLIPDDLEWVLMLQPQTRDTDLDGTDDFIEAVTHELPKNAPGHPDPTVQQLHPQRSKTPCPAKAPIPPADNRTLNCGEP